MDNAHTGYWEDLERLEAKVETSSTSLEVRLQRWELVGTGGAYSEHRSMKRVEPHKGQEFDDSDEWCNAEEVFALEAKVERLAELARTRGNANDHFEKLKRQAERERDETRALLYPFLTFSWTAADKEAARAYFGRIPGQD